MDKRKKLTCDKCGIKLRRFKELKKLNDGYYCSKCSQKKRKDHREYLLRTICGVRKRSDLEIEWKKKRENKVIETRPPKISGAKPRIERRGKIRSLGIYLTKMEKQILYLKYTKNGLSSQEANQRIRNQVEFLGNLVKKMREKNKPQEKIKSKFREEFAKLCGKY